MPRKRKSECCNGESKAGGCCCIEAVISVDERGQMVLPKEVREKAGIKPGDKFALVSWEQNGKVCCIAMVRAGEFSPMVKVVLASMMKDMTTD